MVTFFFVAVRTMGDDHRKATNQPTLEEEAKRPPYDTAR